MPSRRPVIGLTVGTSSTEKQNPRFGTNQVYVHGIERAGAIAVLIPPMAGRQAATLLDRIDGLLVPGGADIDPGFYGEAPAPGVDESDRPRGSLEMALVRAAEKRRMPVFGICRGQQGINVVHGGTLYQDIKTETRRPLKHRSPKSPGREYLAHDVEIDGDSGVAGPALAKRLRGRRLPHHT